MKCPSCEQELPHNSRFCEYCGTAIEPKKKTIDRILHIIPTIAFAISTVFFGVLAHQSSTLLSEQEALYNELSDTYNTLLDSHTELQRELTSLELENSNLTVKVSNYESDIDFYAAYEEKARFLDDNIGFITSTGEKYHTFNCHHFQSAQEFWAHNIEYCEYLGYDACSDCHYEDMTFAQFREKFSDNYKKYSAN